MTRHQPTGPPDPDPSNDLLQDQIDQIQAALDKVKRLKPWLPVLLAGGVDGPFILASFENPRLN